MFIALLSVSIVLIIVSIILWTTLKNPIYINLDQTIKTLQEINTDIEKGQTGNYGKQIRKAYWVRKQFYLKLSKLNNLIYIARKETSRYMSDTRKERGKKTM